MEDKKRIWSFELTEQGTYELIETKAAGMEPAWSTPGSLHICIMAYCSGGLGES